MVSAYYESHIAINTLIMQRLHFLVFGTASFLFSIAAFSQTETNHEIASSSDGPARGSVSIGMQYLIDGDTKPPAIKPSSPTINYPERVLLSGQNGIVELEIVVGETGAVEKVDVRKSDDSIFTAAAVDGVKLFEFIPANTDGTPVSMTILMEVKFSTDDQWTAVYDNSASDTTEETDSWAYVGDATLPEMDQEAFRQNLVYPMEAQINQIRGTVTVRARIGADGTVLETEIQGEADSMLATAAMEAIAKTPFTPGTEGGELVEMWTMIPVNFTITHGLASRSAAESPEKEDQPTVTGSVTQPTFDQAELEQNFVFEGKFSEETEVRMRVMIDETGTVKQVLVPEETNPTLSKAATEAVQKTTFTPGMQSGEPIPVWITISLKVMPRSN